MKTLFSFVRLFNQNWRWGRCKCVGLGFKSPKTMTVAETKNSTQLYLVATSGMVLW